MNKMKVLMAAATALALSACGGGGGSDEGGDPADVPLAQAPALVQQYAALFNVARAKARNCGQDAMPAVQPLTEWNPKLQASAQVHADDMNTKGHFSHIGSDGSDANARAAAHGYIGLVTAENLAGGRGSPTAITNLWLGSDGHCRAIMDSLSHSVVLAQSGKYTVMVFGN